MLTPPVIRINCKRLLYVLASEFNDNSSPDSPYCALTPGFKVAADLRGQAECRKKARGHLRTGQTKRILFIQVAVVQAGDRAHAVEDLVVLQKAVEVAFQQELAVVDGRFHPEPDQPVLMGVGETAKQDAVDDAEDGGDAADAQRHRHHGDPELGWRTSETTECVTEILEGGF
jgi:DNA-binding transcriptional regulator of glucitol operon